MVSSNSQNGTQTHTLPCKQNIIKQTILFQNTNPNNILKRKLNFIPKYKSSQQNYIKFCSKKGKRTLKTKNKNSNSNNQFVSKTEYKIACN